MLLHIKRANNAPEGLVIDGMVYKSVGAVRSHVNSGGSNEIGSRRFPHLIHPYTSDLTKEQCFQRAGLTRSEYIIGPFLALLATALSHRALCDELGPRVSDAARPTGLVERAQCDGATGLPAIKAFQGFLGLALAPVRSLEVAPTKEGCHSHKENLTRTQSLRVLATQVERACSSTLIGAEAA